MPVFLWTFEYRRKRRVNKGIKEIAVIKDASDAYVFWFKVVNCANWISVCLAERQQNLNKKLQQTRTWTMYLKTWHPPKHLPSGLQMMLTIVCELLTERKYFMRWVSLPCQVVQQNASDRRKNLTDHFIFQCFIMSAKMFSGL